MHLFICYLFIYYLKKVKCVVPENIHIPTTEGILDNFIIVIP